MRARAVSRNATEFSTKRKTTKIYHIANSSTAKHGRPLFVLLLEIAIEVKFNLSKYFLRLRSESYIAYNDLSSGAHINQ